MFLEGIDKHGHPCPEAGSEEEADEDDEGDDSEHVHLCLVLNEHVERHDCADVEEHGSRHFAQTRNINLGLLLVREMPVVIDHPIALADEDDEGAADEEQTEGNAKENGGFHNFQELVITNYRDIILILQR